MREKENEGEKERERERENEKDRERRVKIRNAVPLATKKIQYKSDFDDENNFLCQ